MPAAIEGGQRLHQQRQPEVRRWCACVGIDRALAGACLGDPSTGSGRERDKAFRLLTEAVAVYRQIGMPKHAEMVEALLGKP